MPESVFDAAERFVTSLFAVNASSCFIAGAAWGLQAAKLSQAEIAAIVAAVAIEKEKG